VAEAQCRTTEDIVSLATVGGGEHIVYPRMPIDVALIQASTGRRGRQRQPGGRGGAMNVLYQALAAKRFDGG
jgi:acyl CoA:acetate/3-ketoacid CoA transferase